MKDRKAQVHKQIKSFLKEGSKNFEEILEHRQSILKDKRKGVEHLKMDLSMHLSELTTLGEIVVMRNTEGKKQYKLP